MNSISKILESIDDSFWDKLRQNSLERSKRLAEMTWYHYKIYKRVEPFETKVQQTVMTKFGEVPEIPRERELFYLTNARFSLLHNPVAYFANEHATAWEEVIDGFRYNEFLNYYKDIIPYVNGLFDPTPNDILHFIRVKISKDSIILDLANSSNLLIQYFEENWNGENSFYNSIIYTRDEQVYEATQAIAAVANLKGYDGIVFRSVRTESGARHPDLNLVMFSKNKVNRL